MTDLENDVKLASALRVPTFTKNVKVGHPPTLNIVVGARDKTVYVYDSSGCTCKESLKGFNKQQ